MPQTPGVPDHAAPKEPVVKRYKKAITAAVGMIASVTTAGVFHGTTEAILEGILAVATVAGVYQVRNEPGTPPAA